MKRMIAASLMTFAIAGMLSAQDEVAQGEVAEDQVARGPRVMLETNRGAIEIELFSDKAPKTVENFLQYVRDGFYDGTIFHRVIPSFMIQGGGYGADMNKKTTRPDIQNEANNGVRNEIYTVAMARRGDPHSANSQFYINVNNNQSLDHRDPRGSGWGYAVFGKVVSGREVVDAIAITPTGSKGGMGDVPSEPVIIEKAFVVEP